MIKQIIITCIVLALIVSFGIVETTIVNKGFEEFQYSLEKASEKALDGTITIEQANELNDEWIKLRERVEYLITHIDTTEMDMMLSEAVALVKIKEPKLAYVNIMVALELAHHIPHSGMPYFEHIM